MNDSTSQDINNISTNSINKDETVIDISLRDTLEEKNQTEETWLQWSYWTSWFY